MIKILEIEYSKGWGGQERRTVRLVNNLDKSRFRVFFVVQPDSELYKRRNNIDASIIPLRMNQIYNISVVLDLLKIIKNNHIDIISTHSGKDGWLGIEAGKISGRKIIRTRHLQTPITSSISYNLSNKVVAVSNYVKNHLISAGIKKNKVVTIHTGINTNRFTPQKRLNLRNMLNINKETLLVGEVAVLRRAKRHKELIEAFSKIKADAKLLIIGSGPQEKNIKEQIKKSNLQNRVLMLGYRDDIEKILPDLDIFVLTSDMEALGTSLLEAQSCGIPVIGSNVGGIPEAMKDGKTGFLFNDFNDFQKKLTLLLNDKHLREKLSKNARKFIVKNFSVETMVEKTEKVYGELV